MSEDKVYRFEYKLWYQGDWINSVDMAKVISDYVISKGGTPLHAGYGTISVPKEDTGEEDNVHMH